MRWTGSSATITTRHIRGTFLRAYSQPEDEESTNTLFIHKYVGHDSIQRVHHFLCSVQQARERTAMVWSTEQILHEGKTESTQEAAMPPPQDTRLPDTNFPHQTTEREREREGDGGGENLLDPPSRALQASSGLLVKEAKTTVTFFSSGITSDCTCIVSRTCSFTSDWMRGADRPIRAADTPFEADEDSRQKTHLHTHIHTHSHIHTGTQTQTHTCNCRSTRSEGCSSEEK